MSAYGRARFRLPKSTVVLLTSSYFKTALEGDSQQVSGDTGTLGRDCPSSLPAPQSALRIVIPPLRPNSRYPNSVFDVLVVLWTPPLGSHKLLSVLASDFVSNRSSRYRHPSSSPGEGRGYDYFRRTLYSPYDNGKKITPGLQSPQLVSSTGAAQLIRKAKAEGCTVKAIDGSLFIDYKFVGVLPDGFHFRN